MRKKEEAAVNTRKIKLRVSKKTGERWKDFKSKTVEMVTMVFRAKKKNQATCKKSQGQEHKMKEWKEMGNFGI